MQIKTWCLQCLGPPFDLTEPAASQPISRVIEPGDEHSPGFPREVMITTEPVTLIHCPQGHALIHIIADGGYALLYERALRRLALGYVRDAILDAYTALEMYLVHVPARARYDREKGAIASKLCAELEQDATKTAERAWGAAIATAWLVSGIKPPRFNNGMTSLRNRAAHGGKYPKVEEAEQLIFWVAKTILAFKACLDTQTCVNERRYLDQLNYEHWEQVHLANPGTPHAHSNFGTVLAGISFPKTPEERLAFYRQAPELIREMD